MPEYLSPGVYVEETSFRSKSIEGVSTSTAGFVGPTRWGPISGDPELLTSLADFERIYGGLDTLWLDGNPTPNYLAHAVRAFFEEGGQRLYVSRIFNFGAGVSAVPLDGTTKLPSQHYAIASGDNGDLSLAARFPGRLGKMQVTFTIKAGGNSLIDFPQPTKEDPNARGYTLTQVQNGDVVHVRIPIKDSNKKIIAWDDLTSSGIESSPPSSPPSALLGVTNSLFLVHWNTVANPKDPFWELLTDNGSAIQLKALHDISPDIQVRTISVLVEVAYPTLDPQGQPGFSVSTLLGEFDFDTRSVNGLMNVFTRQPITRSLALTTPFSIELDKTVFVLPPDDPTKSAKEREQAREQALNAITLQLIRELLGASVIATLSTVAKDVKPVDTRRTYLLDGGDDGAFPAGVNYEGDPEFADFINDPLQNPKNGLLAFESVDDISIVAAPGYSANSISDDIFAAQSALIDHCEKMKYRIAVIDTPPNNLVSDALVHRNLRSSKYAALYYPWITIVDPLRDQRLNLPPSGFVAGIYARNDTEHAVFKAPANEVVRLAIDFEQRLNKAQQDVLNPQSINCFRYFPGHGFLLWGARTISDDPEWKYVSIRRYFAYLEHSIDKGTQWVVFENNGPQLWLNVRHTIEDFLLNEWKMGGLLGSKPEQAYFVRCDLSTMTQNDLDNGRLVCLIGVAAVKPAEFVIFRIGQWTAGTPV